MMIHALAYEPLISSERIYCGRVFSLEDLIELFIYNIYSINKSIG